MQCPNDSATLLMSERHGVEIDYCPTCRGVWLDRGELDKIVERAARERDEEDEVNHPPPPPPPPPSPSYERQRRDDEPRYEPRDEPRYDPRYPRKKKRKSFLDDLFDFD